MASIPSKVALITGAGGGLERDVALQPGARGHRVALLDISETGSREPSEVAAGVVWLAFDTPDTVTAERLDLSGGLDKD